MERLGLGGGGGGVGGSGFGVSRWWDVGGRWEICMRDEAIASLGCEMLAAW